jgi:hypothetical protein
MVAMLRSWWQKIKKRPIIAAGITVGLLAAFILAAYTFNWDWTGFISGVSKITTTSTPNGTTTAKELQPGKSLWDWLQLLGILAIPIVVGFGTVWFTTQQAKESEAKRAQQDKESEANREKRHQTELEIAEKNRDKQQQTDLQISADNQREGALQTYIDNMSEFLLEKNLRESRRGGEVQIIARARTLTVLPRLDGLRKSSVLQFLYESGLIYKDMQVIDLLGANLREVNLNETNLSGASLDGASLDGANLSGANLSGANLRDANLRDANLRDANLSGADLSGADLSGAILVGAIVTNKQLAEAKSLAGATMPDGTKHD